MAAVMPVGAMAQESPDASADEAAHKPRKCWARNLAAILKEVIGDPGFATMMDALSA